MVTTVKRAAIGLPRVGSGECKAMQTYPPSALSHAWCKLHHGSFDSSFDSDFDTSGLDCPVSRNADSPTYRVPISGI
jgi:hypothetical protein